MSGMGILLLRVNHSEPSQLWVSVCGKGVDIKFLRFCYAVLYLCKSKCYPSTSLIVMVGSLQIIVMVRLW